MTSTPRHGYLVRNPALLAWLRGSDAVLRWIVRGGDTSPALPGEPRRILLAIGGHMGDAVIATAAIELVARAFPQAELGVMAGHGALTVLRDDPRIVRRHLVEHWRTDRGTGGIARRWLRARGTRRRVVRELRDARYDLAVDLSAHYPNAAPLLFRARIPCRLGFTSGGFGALLTHPVAWVPGEAHEVERQQALLARLEPAIADMTPRYRLADPRPAERDRVDALLEAEGVHPGTRLLVVHVGAGDAAKRWPAARWRALLDALPRTAEDRVVLTGMGAAEEGAAAAIAGGDRAIVNLAGCLGWGELVHLVSRAALVASADTVVAHVAAAREVPCAVAFTGRDLPARWRPWGDRVLVLVPEGAPGGYVGGQGGTARAWMRRVADIGADEMRSAIVELRAAGGPGLSEAGAHERVG